MCSEADAMRLHSALEMCRCLNPWQLFLILVAGRDKPHSETGGTAMADTYRPKGLSSAVSYQDPKAAYRWLEAAFGFEPLFVILDADGNLAHSEMVYGNSV